MTEEHRQCADKALASIAKKYGKGTAFFFGDGVIEPIEAISTGSVGLDLAIGIGGVPRGRIVEIIGPESTGKTTLCLQIIAQAQRLGLAAFVDAEHALDITYARKLGVSVEDLLISQPSYGEQALDIVEELAESRSFVVVVVDSVAALVPKAELDGDMGDHHVGVQARMMNQAMRKLAGLARESNTLICFTNQIREQIGVMFGSKETTPGGKGLKFYASVRLDMRRSNVLKDKDKLVGVSTKVKVIKNKCAPPFQEAVFDVLWNKGISQEGEVVDMAADLGIVEKAGSWFSYNGDRLGHGRDAARSALEGSPLLLEEIKEKVINARRDSE
jgi:recombination protein RecA